VDLTEVAIKEVEVVEASDPAAIKDLVMRALMSKITMTRTEKRDTRDLKMNEPFTSLLSKCDLLMGWIDLCLETVIN